MRIVFMGSPTFAAAALRHLVQAGENVVAVVSQPSRASGRGRQPVDPPVAVCGRELGLRVMQPEKASHSEFIAELKALTPDVIVTAAYGQILSQEFLAVPKRATINIHPSLLPAYRGATPVQTALLNGDLTTGVSILFTVQKLDAGNLICQERVAVGADETAAQLLDRLFELGARLLDEALVALRDPQFMGEPQLEAAVSKCRKIQKEDGLVNWTEPAALIYRRFRAYDPWPGLHTYLDGRRVVLVSVRASVAASGGEPGRFRLIKAGGDLPVFEVVTGAAGSLHVTALKPEGGKELRAADFWNGAGNRSSGKFSAPTGLPEGGGGGARAET